MKRLFKSYKFWMALFGAGLGILAWNMTDSELITSLIIGSFSVNAISNQFGKGNKTRSIGGELPPDDDEN